MTERQKLYVINSLGWFVAQEKCRENKVNRRKNLGHFVIAIDMAQNIKKSVLLAIIISLFISIYS